MENQKEVLENSQLETETVDTNTNNTNTTENSEIDTKIPSSGVDNRFKKN